MRALLRILIVIPSGFVVASIGAAMVLFLAAGVTPGASETGGEFAGKVLVVSLIAAIVVGGVTAVPAIVLIVLAEIFGWRSLILHLILGAAIGFTIFMLGPGGAPVTMADVKAGAAAGAAGGFCYWLIAGRNAGRFRETVAATPPE